MTLLEDPAGIVAFLNKFDVQKTIFLNKFQITDVDVQIYKKTSFGFQLVREYKQLYGSILNATLDWEQPKLVLNESMEMLLIADPKDRRGLFHAVPRRPVPKDKES